MVNEFPSPILLNLSEALAEIKCHAIFRMNDEFATMVGVTPKLTHLDPSQTFRIPNCKIEFRWNDKMCVWLDKSPLPAQFHCCNALPESSCIIEEARNLHIAICIEKSMRPRFVSPCTKIRHPGQAISILVDDEVFGCDQNPAILIHYSSLTLASA